MEAPRFAPHLLFGSVIAALAVAGGCGRLGYNITSVDAGRDERGVPGCPRPSEQPFCEALDELRDAPVIDGIVECGLPLVPIAPEGWTGTTPIAATHRAELAVAWHKDGVYFFVHVVTPTVRPPGPADLSWCGDGVEVFFDSDGAFGMPPEYDSPGTRQLIIPSPEGATSTRAVGFVLAVRQDEWAEGRALAVRVADGFVVEAFVKLEDVFLPPGMLMAGRNVGVNVSVNVASPTDGAGACGRRAGQYYLRATNVFNPPAGPCDGLPFCDVSAFCSAQLAPSSG
jgi:hypothetical protein